MKILLTLFLGSISFLSYGQESELKPLSIEWERLSTPLSLLKEDSNHTKYTLLEVNLSIDLREQHLRKNTLTMRLSENQFIQPHYNVAIPQPTSTGKVNFTISGNRYTSNSNTSGTIKNTVYKDASLYSGPYCPITGAAY